MPPRTRSTRRLLRAGPQQPPDQRHRPLQHPLRLLHARVGPSSSSRKDLLSFEEIERFVRVAASLGVDKIRLTGGEPLVRRDLPELVAMTRLRSRDRRYRADDQRDPARAAGPVALWDAGLRADQRQPRTPSTRPVPRTLTRRDGLEQVIEGILAAKSGRLRSPVKLNAIAIKGVTERTSSPSARFAREHGPRTPVHRVHAARRRQCSGSGKGPPRLRDPRPLEPEVGPLSPDPDQDPRAPAMDYDYLDGRGGSA